MDHGLLKQIPAETINGNLKILEKKIPSFLKRYKFGKDLAFVRLTYLHGHS